MIAIPIQFTETALADLEQTMHRYAAHKMPDAGKRFIAEIVEYIGTLSDQPGIGRVAAEFGQPFLRELNYLQMRIVYLRKPNQVRIVRVWRSG